VEIRYYISRETYIAKAKCILVTGVCVSVCLSLAAFSHHCTDPDVTWRNGGGAPPLVMHCWADLQSVHGFRCYANTAPNAKRQRVLVLAPRLVGTGVPVAGGKSRPTSCGPVRCDTCTERGKAPG